MSGTADPLAPLLLIGSRRYSSWSLRGWLAVRLAGLDPEVRMIPLAGGTTPAVRAASPSGRVPALRIDGGWVWESLAIVESCAERAAEAGAPLWPAGRAARAFARSIAAEMHAGFRPLRLALPMNLGREARPRAGGLEPAVRDDIARITALWTQAGAFRDGEGPFLFGARFGAADAMYAPVVTRLLSYGCELDEAAAAYCRAVRAHPLVDEWYRAAAAETGRIDAVERLD